MVGILYRQFFVTVFLVFVAIVFSKIMIARSLALGSSVSLLSNYFFFLGLLKILDCSVEVSSMVVLEFLKLFLITTLLFVVCKWIHETQIIGVLLGFLLTSPPFMMIVFCKTNRSVDALP